MIDPPLPSVSVVLCHKMTRMPVFNPFLNQGVWLWQSFVAFVKLLLVICIQAPKFIEKLNKEKGQKTALNTII